VQIQRRYRVASFSAVKGVSVVCLQPRRNQRAGMMRPPPRTAGLELRLHEAPFLGQELAKLQGPEVDHVEKLLSLATRSCLRVFRADHRALEPT